jgi:hypothetical protein
MEAYRDEEDGRIMNVEAVELWRNSVFYECPTCGVYKRGGRWVKTLHSHGANHDYRNRTITSLSHHGDPSDYSLVNIHITDNTKRPRKKSDDLAIYK